MSIYQSLYVLARYNEVIKNLLKIMIESGYHKTKEHEWTKINQIHFIALSFYVLMDTHSYLDEYDNYFGPKTESEFQDRIKSVKKIAKPATDKIREWKDIREFRNEIISHNWRSGNQFAFEKLGTYNTPRTFQDFLYLQSFLEIIQTVINAEFNKELLNAANYIDNLRQQISPKKANPNFEEEIRKVVQSVNDGCQTEEKSYRINTDAIFII